MIETAKKYCLLSVFALHACTVGSDYIKPIVEVPEHYQSESHWKKAQPAKGVDRSKWWTVFNDQQLNSLQDQLVISNQNLMAAAARFRQAQSLLMEARASYFPTVSADASAMRSAESASKSKGRAVGSTTDYTLGLNARWEADLWGRIGRGVEASRANVEASANDLAAATLSAQTALAQNYFQLRAADAQKKLLNDTIIAYKNSLRLTENQYKQGVVKVQLTATQALAIAVDVQRTKTEHAIALLLGKPAATLKVSAAGEFNHHLPVIPAQLPSALLERRPDIAAAERRVAAANAQIGLTEAAYFPVFGFSAAGGYQNSSFSEWLTAPSHVWSLGPALAATVFDGGARRARTAQAQAIFDEDVALYRQTVLTAFQEVEDNLAALRILAQQSQVQDIAVQAARQDVKLTLNQYKAGIVSYLNVVVAQATQLRNERTALDIRTEQMAASVALIAALGGGWHVDRVIQK
jgi:NodT family efflux transporter outer membrane factor (OMF) lipoprotein